MVCIFCGGGSFVPYTYPKILFHTKEFIYHRCSCCELVQLSVMPDMQDFAMMYPSTYQNSGANKAITWADTETTYGLRYSYQYQLDQIADLVSKDGSILDYGCGDANFLVNARDFGFQDLFGAEFGSELVAILNEELPDMTFLNIENVLAADSTYQFDCIRLSNVLEHLTNPKEVLEALVTRLKKGGILIIEGPIEDNFYPLNVINTLYFKVRKVVKGNNTTSIPPYHIFLANRSNQLALLEQLGLSTILIKVKESSWPYPRNWTEATGVISKFTYLLSRCSQILSQLSGSKWGNTILYIGKA